MAMRNAGLNYQLGTKSVQVLLLFAEYPHAKDIDSGSSVNTNGHANHQHFVKQIFATYDL